MESAAQHTKEGGAGPPIDCEREGVATTSHKVSGINLSKRKKKKKTTSPRPSPLSDGGEGARPDAERPRSGVGRPAKITIEVVRDVGEWIGKGMTEEQACAYCGVNPATFGPAVARNPALKAELNRAQLTFMATALERMSSGCAEGWTSMAWILERRHRKQFCRVEVHAAADQNGELLGFTPEQVEEMRRMALEKAMADRDEEGRGGKGEKGR